MLNKRAVVTPNLHGGTKLKTVKTKKEMLQDNDKQNGSYQPNDGYPSQGGLGQSPFDPYERVSEIREEVSKVGSSLADYGRKVFKGDKVIWTIFIILCVISLVEIFSATSTIVYRQQNQ